MGLECWDERRGKWVLYWSQQEHADDCAKYPFEHIPKRVFLDTNVVNLLVQQSPQIFEQVRIPDELDGTRALDTEALMHVFHIGARADWDILASVKTLDEISRTPDADLRTDLLDYALGLVHTCDRRTIINKRQFVRQLPLRILTPCEWWAHVKPRAAL